MTGARPKGRDVGRCGFLAVTLRLLALALILVGLVHASSPGHAFPDARAATVEARLPGPPPLDPTADRTLPGDCLGHAQCDHQPAIGDGHRHAPSARTAVEVAYAVVVEVAASVVPDGRSEPPRA